MAESATAFLQGKTKPCAACCSTTPSASGAASIPGMLRLANTLHCKQQDIEVPRLHRSRDYTYMFLPAWEIPAPPLWAAQALGSSSSGEPEHRSFCFSTERNCS